MFYNTPNGLQITIDKGWTVSISLAGEDAKEDCEIAVWPTGLRGQDNWVRWGDSASEWSNDDHYLHSKVLQGLTPSEVIRILNRLSDIEVEPNKWLSRSLGRESI